MPGSQWESNLTGTFFSTHISDFISSFNAGGSRGSDEGISSTKVSQPESSKMKTGKHLLLVAAWKAGESVNLGIWWSGVWTFLVLCPWAVDRTSASGNDYKGPLIRPGDTGLSTLPAKQQPLQVSIEPYYSKCSYCS